MLISMNAVKIITWIFFCEAVWLSPTLHQQLWQYFAPWSSLLSCYTMTILREHPVCYSWDVWENRELPTSEVGGPPFYQSKFH